MLWCKRQMEGREHFLLRKQSGKAIISMFCDVFNGSNQETNKSYNREAEVVFGKMANLSSCVKTSREKINKLHFISHLLSGGAELDKVVFYNVQQ